VCRWVHRLVVGGVLRVWRCCGRPRSGWGEPLQNVAP